MFFLYKQWLTLMKQYLLEAAALQSFKMLGITVNALSIPQLNALIAEAVERNQRWIIANHIPLSS